MLSPYLKKVFANISWLTLDQFLRMGMNTMVGVFMARYMGKELFGTYNYAISLVAIFAPFIHFGFDAFIIRDLIGQPEKRDEILGSSFILRVFGAAIAFAATFFLINILRPGEALPQALVMLAASAFFFQAFDVVDLLFRARLKSKFTVWSKTSAFLLINGIKLVCFMAHAPLVVFGVLYLAEAAMGALGMVLIYRNPLGLKIREWYSTAQRMGYVLKEGWPLLLAHASSMLYNRVDQIMVGYYLNDAAVGALSASSKLYEMGLVSVAILNTSFFPLLHDLYKRDQELFFKRYRFITQVYTGISYVILAGVLLFADKVVPLVFGKGFQDSADILRLQIFGLVIMCNAGLRSTYLALTSNQKLLFQTTFFSAVANFLLNLVLIPRYGVFGPPVATIITQAMALLFFNLVYKRTRRLFYIQAEAFIPWMVVRAGWRRLKGLKG